MLPVINQHVIYMYEGRGLVITCQYQQLTFDAVHYNVHTVRSSRLCFDAKMLVVTQYIE
jgi:hypothetical protein